MSGRRALQSVWGALMLAVLAGCAGAPVQPAADPDANRAGQVSIPMAVNLDALYAPGANLPGKVFKLNPTASQIRIYAFRGGRAVQFGHNHVLSAPEFIGYFYLAPEGPAASRFNLEFRLDALELDRPEHRAALGPAFASVLSPSAVASTRANMLGANGLQADMHPLVKIQSLQIAGEAPKFAAQIAVELHGQVRVLWLPLTVLGLPDHVRAEGALVLRQTDFGIKPYSLYGDVLTVQDALVLEFTLSSAP